MTRKEAVYNYMISNGTATTTEINSVVVGGSEGTKRLRELRAEGRLDYSIKKVPNSTQYRYTLI